MFISQLQQFFILLSCGSVNMASFQYYVCVRVLSRLKYQPTVLLFLRIRQFNRCINPRIHFLECLSISSYSRPLVPNDSVCMIYLFLPVCINLYDKLSTLRFSGICMNFYRCISSSSSHFCPFYYSFLCHQSP